MTTVIAIAERVARGEVTAEAVCREALAAIDSKDGALHAMLHVARQEALEAARAVDAKRARGQALGPLAGVPVSVKDSLCTRGVPTTAASKILAGYVPPYDATAVARLRQADAVIVGKTNLDELAMGSSTENSAWGPTRNPWDTSRTPGGSSGGSAAAVAARMTPCALGSDTGGSIRQPAALTGTVGIKPTYGLVSRYGLIAFASSLDQVGPLATDVRGAARVLSVIAGHDARDATSLDAPAPDHLEAACDRGVRGLRVGVPDEYFGQGLDAGVEASVRQALRALEDRGCSLHPVTLPHTRYAVATYYVLATAEASSNLSRLDGVRYGLRVSGKGGEHDLRAMIGATRDAGFGAEVKRRILLGTFVLSAGHYDAYYLKGQQVRTLVRRDFDEALRSVDVLCSPVSPTTAFRLGERTGDPLTMYLSDVYTLPASLAGVPAMSVPCAPVGGLPVGLQVMAGARGEATMLAVAAACEADFPCASPP